MVIVFRCCRDVSGNVSTAGIEIAQQERQGAVGLAPHQAVDGGQFGRDDDGGRRDESRLYRVVIRAGASRHNKKNHYSYPNHALHACKDRKIKRLFQFLFQFLRATARLLGFLPIFLGFAVFAELEQDVAVML